MSRPRGQSEASRHSHSVSLKVLRLSKPSLTAQHALPKLHAEDEFKIDAHAARNHPQSHHDEQFALSPALTLPPSFGAAYVGETFACSLCANCELPAKQHGKHSTVISGVRITAEMQTPSTQPQGIALDVTGSESAGEGEGQNGPTQDSERLGAGETLQRIVRHELREEGPHVLAVTVSYTEMQVDQAGEEGVVGAATGGKGRVFRKLYQFNAVQLLNVRTKVQLLPQPVFSAKQPRERAIDAATTRYVLEAQLENLGEGIIALESVSTVPKEAFEARSLNVWEWQSEKDGSRPLLGPRDVVQTAFMLEGKRGMEEEIEEGRDGTQRVLVCQLSIQWRGTMGDKGSLSTGWLSGKKQ